jgi:hypothetical protein|tara:strand:- start:30 stop:1358 length:1329 start_codon:yes stop_codon:yes gene_type:complete
MADVYPFSEFNGRMFYACMGVLVNKTGDRWGRLTQTGNADATDSTFLTGVQSVGVSSDNPSSSLVDVGRFQRKYHYYSQQQFEITIERVITETENFFYHVDPSSYVATEAGYRDCHILKDDNIGCQGSTNPNSKSIRNFDITILYGSDQFNRLGSENHTTPSSSNPDKNKVFQVTYRNCLVTSINYNMSVGTPITEVITLITKGATYNENITASAYTLPAAETAQSANLLKAYDLDLLNTGPDWGIRYSVLPEEVIRMFKAQNVSGDTQSEGAPGTLQDILGLSSISIDTSIDYSEITDVGKWRGSIDQGLQNLWRHVVLPVQVTASFTGTLRQPFPRRGSPASYLPNTDTTFSAADGNTSSKDWQYVNREIKLVAKKFTATPNFFVWDLGKKNYLTNFSYTGGDTGGGNLEGTMSYQNDTSDIVLIRDTVVRDLPAPTNPY